ncbi:acetamidase/formamidase family protein [Peribacillus acanthi]|uniref:acetamidase/formamidase family protein n=1 Tax=Peribacillus acanthi TaxID=2171554 RepID=UPI000D3E9022|nr:acetamidase/formamidase family protein [Peribacillus acanthi]
MSKTHIIKLENANLQASFSRDYKPIIMIESGDTIHFSTPDIGWGYNQSNGNRIQFQSREQEGRWGHPIIGPIAIKNARPGMTLEVVINKLRAGTYGWNCAGGRSSWVNDRLGISDDHEVTLNWKIHNIAECEIEGVNFEVEVKPFLGLLGTTPCEEGVHSTIPPRYCGGNIDCKELVEGSRLFLPIAVEGALFTAGDGHAAQGDGEVSGQAIECPMDFVDLTLFIHEELSIKYPRAYTPNGWITFGFDEDLNVATEHALEAMVELIQEQYRVNKAEATALASVVVDLRITQIVNGAKGVHAVLPHSAIKTNVNNV